MSAVVEEEKATLIQQNKADQLNKFRRTVQKRVSKATTLQRNRALLLQNDKASFEYSAFVVCKVVKLVYLLPMV